MDEHKYHEHEFNDIKLFGYNLIGYELLKSFKKIIVHERCEHTAKEFRLYSYKTDRLTEEVLPIIIDKHNHCIDSIRYAIGGLIRVGFFAGNDLG